jgi:hypothetical protein
MTQRWMLVALTAAIALIVAVWMWREQTQAAMCLRCR